MSAALTHTRRTHAATTAWGSAVPTTSAAKCVSRSSSCMWALARLHPTAITLVMALVAAYRALAPTASVHSVLDAASTAAVADTERAELIQAIVDDIVAVRAGQPSRLGPKGACSGVYVLR
jgi:hypothetical protein